MDFSKKGIVDGLKKMASVAVYILISMAVIGLGMYVADQTITWVEVRTAMLVGGANLVLVFLQKWLSTTVDKK